MSVQIKNRVIQRCLVCGFKLLDTEDSDPRMNMPSSWPVGAIIEVGPKYTMVIDFTSKPIINKVPKNFCVDLIE